MDGGAGPHPGTPGERLTRRLRIASEAEAEVAAAALWYESKRAGLGAEFVAAVDAGLERILDGPAAFPLWRQGVPYRRSLLARFPFVVFFVLSEDDVEVVAVAHAKRRPGYWAGR
jgi:plasmid stabilization system protein ParE